MEPLSPYHEVHEQGIIGSLPEKGGHKKKRDIIHSSDHNLVRFGFFIVVGSEITQKSECNLMQCNAVCGPTT